MDTVKFDKKNVKIVAHRGLSGIELENTNAAFVAAGNRSYFGIETDVHVTADGKYVLHHDDRTGRLTDVDIRIEEISFDELMKLKLRRSTDTPAMLRRDCVMPVLDDYIEICKKYNKTGVLELKGRITKEHIGGIVKVADRYGYLDKIIFISFDWNNLIDLKSLVPEQKAQYLTSEYSSELVSRLKANGIDLDIHHSALNDTNVHELHANGIEVNCWTCDNSERGEELASYGVDYITSNILE
ncbi:MAG: hypothetical protein IJ391_03485 [Clostridia bacterium]|nr:hypothetical protein [Clostridia bacterium]